MADKEEIPNRAERVPLSMIDPDDIEHERSGMQFHRQTELCNNIFNAYLIAKYKPSEKRNWQKTSAFIRFYISILPYFIAVVQWAAVIIMMIVQFYAFEGGSGTLFEFDLWPTHNYKPKMLMWPFWFIALSYTYQKTLSCEVDIWALKYEGIVVIDLSQNGCKVNLEIFFLKHLTESVLSQWGSIIFYSLVAGYSDFQDLGDFLDIIWNILGWIFIFELDEYAYNLVKDIFVYSFHRQSSTDNPVTPFYGKAVFNIDGTRQAPFRLLAVFFASLVIEGIFVRSYFILFVFGGLWVITEIIKIFIAGHQFNLCLKTKND